MERTLLFIFSLNVALYASHLYLYFYKVGQSDFKPLYWYAFTLALAAVTLLSTRILRHRPLPTPLLLWLLFFFAYQAFAYLYSSQSALALQTLVSGLEMGLLFLAFLLLFRIRGATDAARRVLLLVGVAAALLNFADFIQPTWTEVPGRAAGLYANPNTSATVLTLCMVAGVGVLPPRLRLPYCLFIGAAVVVTFSRAGWLQWAVGLFGLVALGIVRTSWVAAMSAVAGTGALLILLLSGAGATLFAALGIEEHLSRGVLQRLADPISGASTDDRLALISRAAEVFFDHPLFGAGLASTQEWDAAQRPHDTFLYLAAEGGLLGLMLFVSLLWVLWGLTRGEDRLIVVLFGVFSLFSHNALEKPELFLLLALAVSSTFQVRRAPAPEAERISDEDYMPSLATAPGDRP